jgi:hypothetical protein
MPRFYFHVYNDEVTMDEEGQDLPDAEAARNEATKSARALICDEVLKGVLKLSDRIEVEDEERRSVLTLTFGDVVRITP